MVQFDHARFIQNNMSEQMHFKQLELNLWDNLEQAAAAPDLANLDALCQQLEAAIAPLPQQLQLQTAAKGILKIVQIYASRSDWLLSSWEQAHNSEGPVVAEEMLSGLVRQTMTLDLTALIEAPEPEHRTRRTPSEPRSVAGTYLFLCLHLAHPDDNLTLKPYY